MNNTTFNHDEPMMNGIPVRLSAAVFGKVDPEDALMFGLELAKDQSKFTSTIRDLAKKYGVDFLSLLEYSAYGVHRFATDPENIKIFRKED